MDDGHIRAINSLAARLERQNCDDVETVKKRKRELNERYGFSETRTHKHKDTHIDTHMHSHTLTCIIVRHFLVAQSQTC